MNNTNYKQFDAVALRDSILSKLKQPTTKTLMQQIQKLNIQPGLPSFETYLHVYTDLPVTAIDELMNIVKTSPTKLAFDVFCRKWQLQ